MNTDIVRRLILVCAVVMRATATDAPNADTIVSKLVEADRARAGSLPGYTGTRTYFVENTRFNTRAKMKVNVSVDAGGVKRFRVIEASGPGAVRKMVFQRMLDTESKASLKAARDATQVTPANYSFTYVNTETNEGRSSYVLDAEPKTDNPLLFRGRIWIDASDFAIVRIEGSPAKNPSFWIKKTKFVHTYTKVGDYWLGSSNQSETDVRMFGYSVTRIEYSDYVLSNQPQRSSNREVVHLPDR
jgi:hypothetical protein